ILELLRNVAAGTNEFAFVSAKARAAAAASFERGLNCVLSARITTNGRRTGWAQQYDMLTLKPTSARNYEMPAQAAGESAGVLAFLMGLPEPRPEVVAAVPEASAWFEKTAIRDVAFRNVDSDGRHLVPAPGNGPVWARYYEIGSDRRRLGDRDK